MNETERANFHRAQEAGARAQAAVDAARAAAPAEQPMTPEQRAEFLSHREELLPSQQFADAPIRPETGDIGGDSGSNLHRSLSSDPLPGIAEGSVLAQITSPFGTPRASFEDVKPTDQIKIGNMSTSVEVALKMRAIEFNPRTGAYSVPAGPSPEALAGEAAQQAAAKAADAAERVDVLSPGMNQALQNITEYTGSPERTQALAVGCIVKAIDGDFEAAGRKLAAGIGQNPADGTYAQDVQAMVTDGTKSVVDRLNASGVPGEATISWIAANMNSVDRANLAVALLNSTPGAYERILAIGRKVQRAQASGK